MTHQEIVFFVNHVLMVKFIKSNFQLLEGREQTSYSSLSTVMLVARLRHHLLVDAITFLPLLMTILSMCVYILKSNKSQVFQKFVEWKNSSRKFVREQN